jgi:spore coat protein U-like protein
MVASTLKHMVYGHMPARSTPAAGTYTDTVTVTVTY